MVDMLDSKETLLDEIRRLEKFEAFCKRYFITREMGNGDAKNLRGVSLKDESNAHFIESHEMYLLLTEQLSASKPNETCFYCGNGFDTQGEYIQHLIDDHKDVYSYEDTTSESKNGDE